MVWHQICLFQSFPNKNNGWDTLYSSLDLLDWTQSSEWSAPKSVWEHPLFANDPYIKLFKEFSLNFKIEDFIKTIVYSHHMKTYFFVAKISSPSDGNQLRYYSATILNPCDHLYQYSKNVESLGSALQPVIQPLDFCFFIETSRWSRNAKILLYCVGGESFQINQVVSRYRVWYSVDNDIRIIMAFLDRMARFGPIRSQMPTNCRQSRDSNWSEIWWVFSDCQLINDELFIVSLFYSLVSLYGQSESSEDKDRSELGRPASRFGYQQLKARRYEHRKYQRFQQTLLDHCRCPNRLICLQCGSIGDCLVCQKTATFGQYLNVRESDKIVSFISVSFQ